MLKKILITLAALVAVLLIAVGVFLIVAALQPGEFRVTRSATIAAPQADVFAHVNDFHKWDAWSPWAKLDPDAKLTFEGPSTGKGAIFKWVGNDKVGEGGMLITESNPSDLIRIKLDFIKPFQSSADVEFTFKTEGDKTVVTWTMSGKNDLMGKAMCLFMDMEKMLGGDFEKGLANMKSVAEKK